MTKTISKTFRISPESAREIKDEAKKRGLSHGQYLMFVLYENKRLRMQKEFEKNLCVMEAHVEYQKEQRDLANSDFL